MRRARTACWIGLGLCFGIGGCNSFGPTAESQEPYPDPLLGRVDPLEDPDRALASEDRGRDRGEDRSVRVYPPMGSPLLRGEEITPAAMAAGLRSRQGNESDLRIDRPEDRIEAQRASDPQRNSGGVILRPPTGVTAGDAPPLAPRDEFKEITPVGTQRPAPVENYESLVAELRDYGAIEIRNRQSNGEWTFSCAVPNRSNQLMQRRYEAHDPDLLRAVRAVLERVREDQQTGRLGM